jgi:hypothetical protein
VHNSCAIPGLLIADQSPENGAVAAMLHPTEFAAAAAFEGVGSGGRSLHLLVVLMNFWDDCGA